MARKILIWLFIVGAISALFAPDHVTLLDAAMLAVVIAATLETVAVVNTAATGLLPGGSIMQDGDSKNG